jgi:lipoate-protein ligase A
MSTVESRRATVAELHALDPFAGRRVREPEVWICDLVDAAIVLGSRQTPDLLDHDACRAAGLGIVRRRSGGGVVLLRPDAAVWVDVVLPHGVAPDDVRGSMIWVGQRWGDVLRDVVDGVVTVHSGGMVCTPWSELVCFAGVGPGEVLVDGRKLLGLSQRRTRHGLRVQGTLYRRPVTRQIPSLLVGSRPDVPLDEPHWQPSLEAADLAARLAARLAD